MDIYIFNKDIERVGIIDTYNTLMWNRKYYDCGNFELHLPLDNNLELLKIGNIICKANRLDEAGYITYRNLQEIKSGEEKLIVKGKFLKGYISKRIIWNTTIFNDTAQKCIRKLVDENCINTNIINRKIDKLFLGSTIVCNQKLSNQVSYKNVLNEINKICLMTGISTKIRLDVYTKRLIFEVWQGLDRTINQNINSWAVFSQEYDNVIQQNYVDSVSNYCNTALVGGKGEKEDREFSVIGLENKGIDRDELFIDAKDVGSLNDLQDRGQKKLNEHKKITTFDSIVNAYSNLTYEEDYNLGDIITFKSEKWGLTLNTRITEIKEVYDKNGFSINCTFGDNIPTLIDVIKNIQNS